MSTETATEFDVLCVGLITVDHVCAPLRRLPSPGELEMTGRIEPCIGGSAANVALDLRRVGRRVSIACRVGNDVLGHFVAKVLSEEGVLCDHLTCSDTAPTATTMVVNVRGEDRRFIHDAGANAELTGDEVPLDVISRGRAPTGGLLVTRTSTSDGPSPESAFRTIRPCRALYIGGFGLNPALSGENVARLFTAARQAGVLTVLDVVLGGADVNAMLTPVLPLTDLFFPNEDEGLAMTGLDDPVEQARLFHQRGARCVVVTRGKQGTILVDEERCVSMGAPAVEQVDATGGGDAFAAGYVHAHLDGMSPEECLRYGSALGASCVQSAGATTGVFRADELAAFVRDHPLPVTTLS